MTMRLSDGDEEEMDERPARTEIDTRLDTLRAAHRALDDLISQITAQFPRDEVELQRLKKQKLALKDRIVHLESDSHPRHHRLTLRPSGGPFSRVTWPILRPGRISRLP